MREDCQFSPNMLLEAVVGRGLTMGLVVDLTKTDRCVSVDLSVLPSQAAIAGSMIKQLWCLKESAIIN